VIQKPPTHPAHASSRCCGWPHPPPPGALISPAGKKLTFAARMHLIVNAAPAPSPSLPFRPRSAINSLNMNPTSPSHTRRWSLWDPTWRGAN